MNPRPDETEMFQSDLAALNADPLPEDRWKFYTILQVPRAATTHEIEQSYRRLSKVFHTDRLRRKLQREKREITAQQLAHYEATGRLTMSLVNQAKSVLTDPVRRAAYDRHGVDGLAAFESLDVAVRETAKPSEIMAMLDILRSTKRQNEVDVQLETSGAVILMVDASDYMDVLVAKLFTGHRGAVRNTLLDIEAAELGYVEAPSIRAVTVQHVSQIYASEKMTITAGGALQAANSLAASRAFFTVARAVTARTTVRVQPSVLETGKLGLEVGKCPASDI